MGSGSGKGEVGGGFDLTYSVPISVRQNVRKSLTLLLLLHGEVLALLANTPIPLH